MPILLPLPPAQQRNLPPLPPGWTPLVEMGSFLVHRERQPMARHRVACDLPALRRLAKGPAPADEAMGLLRRGAVRVSLVQDWLVDLSGKMRRQRLEAFLDVHWTGKEPWRNRREVEHYLSLFSLPANTGDVVRLCFEPEGRLWVQVRPGAAWVALPDSDLCRTLLEGLLGPKALDQGLPVGLRESLGKALAR